MVSEAADAGRASGRARPAGSYGLDAAWVPFLWLACGVACLIGVFANLGAPAPWNVIVPGYLAVLTVLFIAGGLAYLHATLRGKFQVWGEVLDALQLAGDEHALDLGCGRGAVAIMLARRLPAGEVTGIDLWRSRDQSGNSTEHAEANLAANGVADRVRLVTGDMTALPFDDASVDLVTASLAIHNIHADGGRERAVTKALRVLKPGGRLVIVDISATKQYEAALREAGALDVHRRGLGWRVWWTGPWMHTELVTARKPAA